MKQHFSKQLILALHLIALLLYRIFGYSGHFGFDDMEYAEVAYQLTQGHFDFGNHFFYRFALIVPTAISYLLFGVNDISSSIPPIIASGLILILVYMFMKKSSPRSLSLALSMTLFSEWFLFYGNKLMVDIYVCLAVVFTIYIIYSYRFGSNKSPDKYAILFALGLLYGFVAKGTIILIIPLLAFISLHDLIRKKNISFWLKSITFSIISFLVYFAFIHWISGDFSSRFKAISANGYVNNCSYALQATEVLIKRITVDFFNMFISEGFAFSFVFVVAALLYAKKFQFFQQNTKLGFLLTSSLILTLSANFMSISLDTYNPMCLDFRHYLWLVPITSVAVAEIICERKKGNSFNLIIITLLGILLLISYLNNAKLFLSLYLPIFILFLIYSFLKNTSFNNYIFPILFSAVFLIQPIKVSLVAAKNNYPGQMSFIKEHLIDKGPKSVVVTDIVQARIGNYLASFDSSKTAFLPFDSVAQASRLNEDKILLINPYTQFFSGVKKLDYPFFVKHAVSKSKPYLKNKDLDIKAYRLEQITEPRLTGKLIFNSFMDFEKTDLNWRTNKKTITDSTAYQGNYSNKPGEYSGSLKLILDSLELDKNKTLYIDVTAYTLFKEKTKAKLVVSVKNNEGNIYWHGFELDKFQNVYSNWWKIEAYTSLKASDLKPESELTVFIWNKNKEFVLLDDFKVSIYSY